MGDDVHRRTIWTLARHLRDAAPENAAAWREVDGYHGVPSCGTVAFVNGRLEIGSNDCGTRDTMGKWMTRIVVAMARASSDESQCVAHTAHLLKIATDGLGWPCEIDCDTCYETGICLQTNCPRCEWKIADCSKNEKFVWPELVGRPAWLAALILKQLNPSKRVVLDTFDMLYQTPAHPDVIRIVYDAITGFVTTPPPYVTSAPEIATPRDACFISPDEGLCLGAPPNPPPAEWASFVGQRVSDAVMYLRRVYMHAAVVAIPSTQLITRDYRHDRIRVRFDPQTLLVTHIPTVG